MKENNLKKEQFLEAYELNNDSLFRYALFKVSNRETALDIVQDTFTKTWEYLMRGYEIDNLKAFLYKTLNNLVIDFYRKKKSDSLDNLLEKGFDYGIDIKVAIENKIYHEYILEKLSELDEKHKEVIMLRYVEDMEISEIAEIISESENNVSVRIHRAIDKLKGLIKENE